MFWPTNNLWFAIEMAAALQSAGDYGQKRRVLDPSPHVDKRQIILVKGGGARTPSEHCRGTLEEGIEPPYAATGTSDELMTHSGMYLTHMQMG